MSWRVTYINREGVRVLHSEYLHKSDAVSEAELWNSSPWSTTQDFGPQAVRTFRAEEDKPAHSEAFDLLAAENAELNAKLQLAEERLFYLDARIRRALSLLPAGHGGPTLKWVEAVQAVREALEGKL